jgi:hypothetical protein
MAEQGDWGASRWRVRRGVVSVVCGLLVVLAAHSSEAFAATWASGIEAGLPANAGANPEVSLDHVSCASAGNCSAVGSYFDSSGYWQGLLLSETGGRWTVGTEPVLPADAASDPYPVLYSVSCTSPGNCTAVGYYVDSGSSEVGLILSETAGTWNRGFEPMVPANDGSLDAHVTSVSCASAGNCSAVGVYPDSSGHGQGLLLNEVAGNWAAGTQATLPTNAGSNPGVDLDSVSCASAGNCSAVGTYTDSSGYGQGFLLSETDGSWESATQATLPANAGSDPSVQLGSVSCASAGNCSAVGTYTDSSGNQQGLLLSETDGSWASGAEAALAPIGQQAADLRLSSVSCASAGNCTAVGYYYSPFPLAPADPGVLLAEVAGTWEPGVEVPHISDFGDTGVSCVPAGQCVAVGQSEANGATAGVLFSGTAGSSSPEVAVPPPNAGPNAAVDPMSVSCTPVDACTVVGTYTDSSGHSEGLLLGTQVELSQLRVTPKAFVLRGRRVNGRCIKQTRRNRARPRCTRPIKLTASYQLTGPATVVLTLTRVLPGRLDRKRCLRPTRKTRKHRSCTRLVALHGALTEDGIQGVNRVALTGRMAGHTLTAGKYRLTATLQVDGQADTSQTIGFTIAL